MSYKLKKVGSGYKVCKNDGGKCFSKKPIPKARAKRQIAHIVASDK